MKFQVYVFSVFLASLLGIASTSAREFLHPGVLNNAADLDHMRENVQAGKQPWVAAYEELKSSEYSSLSYTQKPVPHVKCGFYNKPNIGCNAMVEDAVAAYTLTLRWYVERDPRYAEKARRIIMDWAEVYQQNSDKNSRLVVAWATPWHVGAAEILRYTPGSGWNEEHTLRFQTMLDRFKDQLITAWVDVNLPANNWIMSVIEARLAMAVYEEDEALFEQSIADWKMRVPTYIYLSSDGPTPREDPTLEEGKTESVWKHGEDKPSIRYIDGLSMETCRDMNHTKLGLFSIFYGAEIAYNQGIDLFATEKLRIKECLELHAGWWLGEKVPEYINGGELDWKGPREESQVAFELIYNHLHDRLKLQLPKVKELIDLKRPLNASPWVTKWETLCYAGRSFDDSPSCCIGSKESKEQR